jgi:hypothetical protein
MQSRLPITGTAELLVTLSDFVPDEFINTWLQALQHFHAFEAGQAEVEQNTTSNRRWAAWAMPSGPGRGFLALQGTQQGVGIGAVAVVHEFILSNPAADSASRCSSSRQNCGG